MPRDSEFAKIYRSLLKQEGLTQQLQESKFDEMRAAQPSKFDPYLFGARLYIPRKPSIFDKR